MVTVVTACHMAVTRFTVACVMAMKGLAVTDEAGVTAVTGLAVTHEAASWP